MSCSSPVWCGILYFNFVYDILEILLSLEVEQIRCFYLDDLDISSHTHDVSH